MCGICGKVSLHNQNPVDPSVVRRMTDILHHRGPDDEGIYVEGQAVLGHRRLSIIDLNTGKQPICNEDGTVWVVYNGEIYNFRQLRQELVQYGHVFRTTTDTEVIVHLYEQYGEACVSKLEGMFAFALWDKRNKTLLLARDRVGIKPLYFTQTEDSLLFASEIKALLVDKAVKKEVDPGAIDTFLTYFYLPGSSTLLRGVEKLLPGHYLILQDGKLRIQQYWDLQFLKNPSNGNLKGTTDELIELLQRTVRGHMISDVPVGILLSGGVDSTGLLSFMVEETDYDVSSFTIGFEGEQFADERIYAKLAAEKFGNKHYEISISANDFRDFLPKYVWHMEEPVCEPPAVALYYVTRLAREHVKVLLSGEGGDEAFAGYQNYRNLLWLERLKRLGPPWTGIAAGLFRRFSRLPALQRLEKYCLSVQAPLETYYYTRTAGPFTFFNRSKENLYTPEFRETISQHHSLKFTNDLFEHIASQSCLNKMLYVDTKTWLPDDLLIKADKMTMANSVELRVPLLDHKVLEFAARLPENYKVGLFTTKRILKKALEKRVPKRILNRKKTGFPVPVESWLSHDLKEFTCGILSDRETRERGYFSKQFTEGLVNDPVQRARYSAEIFSLITLELWHRKFVDQPAVSLGN